MNDCGNLAALNMSQSSNGSGKEDSVSVDEISELLCPNDCTFNGKCINGSCACNKDYTAEDCSVSIYQRPIISRSVSTKSKIAWFLLLLFCRTSICFFFSRQKKFLFVLCLSLFFFTPIQTGFWRDFYDKGKWRGRRPQGLAYER